MANENRTIRTGKRYFLIDWGGEKVTGVICFDMGEMTFSRWTVNDTGWVEDNTAASFVMGDDAGRAREVDEAEAEEWIGRFSDTKAGTG